MNSMNCLSCKVKMRINPITRDVQDNDRSFFKKCLICKKHIAGYCRKCAQEYLKMDYIRIDWMSKLISKKNEHHKDEHTSIDLI